jgi:hypothetical protein
LWLGMWTLFDAVRIFSLTDWSIAGVPILTLSSASFPGKVCSSLLKSLGHVQYLVTYSWREYLDLGVALLRTPQLLAQLRIDILQKMWVPGENDLWWGRVLQINVIHSDKSVLFNPKRYSYLIERATSAAWDVRAWQVDLYKKSVRDPRIKSFGISLWRPLERTSSGKQHLIVGANDWCDPYFSFAHATGNKLIESKRQVLCYWITLRSTQRAYRHVKYGFIAWHIIAVPG